MKNTLFKLKFKDEEKQKALEKAIEELRNLLSANLTFYYVLGKISENENILQNVKGILDPEIAKQLASDPTPFFSNVADLIFTQILSIVKFINDNEGEIEKFNINDEILHILLAENEKLDVDDDLTEVLDKLSIVEDYIKAWKFYFKYFIMLKGGL